MKNFKLSRFLAKTFSEEEGFTTPLTRKVHFKMPLDQIIESSINLSSI